MELLAQGQPRPKLAWVFWGGLCWDPQDNPYIQKFATGTHGTQHTVELMVKIHYRDFPAGPVVKTSPSNAEGVSSIPDGGAKIPHVLEPKNQNVKQK